MTETAGDQTVNGTVIVDDLAPYRNYNISIYETGHTCILIQNVASVFTDGGGKGFVHFQFWAHTGETGAWACVQHGATTDIVKSTVLPINR